MTAGRARVSGLRESPNECRGWPGLKCLWLKGEPQQSDVSACPCGQPRGPLFDVGQRGIDIVDGTRQLDP